MNNNNEKAEILYELIQNDPYIAFFIHFLSDFGLEPLLHSSNNTIINPKTQTKIIALSTSKIAILQNSKKLEIPIHYARQLIIQRYGKLPLEYF
jgi:hypothetical protein